MKTRYRPAIAALIGVALSATAVLGGAAANGAAASAATSGLSYVALGDSYAAGFGLSPLTGLPTPDCGQAAVDYPHQVAETLDMTLTDVTCAGAETTDLAAQTAALSADTKVVSVTIGGNDLGFASVAQECLADTAEGPLLADDMMSGCASELQDAGIAGAIVGYVAPRISESFANIAVAAPNAKIFVVGYPAIFPATIPAAGCFSPLGTPNGFPFTDADAVFLHGVETSLNTAIKNASEEAGFTFVPATADSADHSACALPGEAYVNGITLSATTGEPEPFSLHPTAAGVASMAEQLASAVSDAFQVEAGTPSPTPSPTASPSESPAPSESPSPSASPSESPTPSPSASPTESPTPTPSATPSPTASPTPSSTPTPTPSPTPSPSGIPAAPFSSAAGLVPANQGSVSVTQSGKLATVSVPSAAAGDQVYVYGYSTPVLLGAYTLNGAKNITVNTSGLAAGAHHLLVLSATGNVIGWAAITVKAIALPVVSG